MTDFELKRYVCTLILTFTQIFPDIIPEFELYKVSEIFEYVDGKPTENIIGYKFHTIARNKEFEKYDVKIKCDKPIITNEQIAQHGAPIKIGFNNMTGRIYKDRNGAYVFSYSADGLEVI